MIVIHYILGFAAVFASLASSFAPPASTCQSAALQRSYHRWQAVAGGDEEAANSNKAKEDSDFSDFDEAKTGDYTGSVDWDAEWKKVMENQGQPEQRPGKGYYKSEAELTALRAANQAREKAIQATAQMPSMPTWNSVKNDWKVRARKYLDRVYVCRVLSIVLVSFISWQFWIGVLAAVSVATSLIASAGTSSNILPPTGSPDSYYI